MQQQPYQQIFEHENVLTMSSSTAAGKVSTKTATSNQLESIVQKRLNIKWVHAKQLIRDASRNCEIIADDNSKSIAIILNRQDEIIEEACEIFSDLTTTEQDQMRLHHSKETPSNDDEDSEPEWKRKARIQAERREAEWQLQQNIQQNQDKIQTLLKDNKQTIIPPDEIPLTTVKSIRALAHDPIPKESPAPDTVPIVRVRTTTCYCTIQ